jgi:deoxyribonuclease-4
LRIDCVQVFTRNQRQWSARALGDDEQAAWRAGLSQLGWHRRRGPCRTVSHNSYLINLASTDRAVRNRSLAAQRAELERCQALGIPLCVIHPGAHLGRPPPAEPPVTGLPPTRDERAGLMRVIKALDRIHRDLPGYGVITCLETTAGAGTTLGYRFEHLAFIREHVREPDRVGYCFDTCHVTAAGYDMTTDNGAAAVLRTFDEVCGRRHLRVFHLNDSVGAVGSRRDRHAHIGRGVCGFACFRAIVNSRAFARVPKIIETPKGTDEKGVPWDVANLRRLKRLVRRRGAGRARPRGGSPRPTGSSMRHRSAGLVVCVLLALAAAGCGGAGKAAPGGMEAVAPPRPPDPHQRQRELAEEAEDAKTTGEYERALSLFRQILADNPTAAVAYVGIGEVYLLKEDFAGAEPVFARAARLEPRSYDAQYGHGVALQMLERFVEAIKSFHRALTIRPESVEANLHLATVYLQTGEPRSALVFAEKVIQLDPASGPGRATLGSTYVALGRHREAVAQYEAAVELMEPTPPLLINLINALGKLERYVDAKNTAEYLIRLAPSAEAYERLGWANFRLAVYDESIEAYRRAVALDGDCWPALNGVGCNALNAWLLSNNRDTAALAEAKQAFRRSLQVNPDQPKVVALLTRYGV